MENQEDPAVIYIVWYFICGIFILIILLIMVIMMATPQEFHDFLTTLPGYTTLGPLVLLILALLIVLFWPLFYIFIGLFGFVISYILPDNSIVPLLCLGIILTPFISKPITDYLLSKRRASQISIQESIFK